MNQNPFTVYELRLALYPLNADGQPLAQAWIGGAAESCTFDLTYKTKAMEYAGVKFGIEIPIDEEHLISLRNVWLHDISTGTARTVNANRRGARYTLVASWYDREVTCWVKRTYSGVTTRAHKLSGGQTEQTLDFRAESMSETAGYATVPSLEPVVAGRIDYVNGAERTTLYNYDPGTMLFSAADNSLLASRAVMTAAVSVVTMAFGASVVLLAGASMLQVTEYNGVSGTLSDVNPRLEFYSGAKRLAALGADGRLVVPNLIETPTDPGQAGMSFHLSGGAWVMTLAPGVVYVPSLNEG